MSKAKSRVLLSAGIVGIAAGVLTAVSVSSFWFNTKSDSLLFLVFFFFLWLFFMIAIIAATALIVMSALVCTKSLRAKKGFPIAGTALSGGILLFFAYAFMAGGRTATVEYFPYLDPTLSVIAMAFLLVLLAATLALYIIGLALPKNGKEEIPNNS